MTFVHFKLAYNGRTHRFTTITHGDELLPEVRFRVGKIVQKYFKLYWNDGDCNVLIETVDDLFAAIDYEKASELSPPCVHLTVALIRTNDVETVEDEEEKQLQLQNAATQAATDAAATTADDDVTVAEKEKKADDNNADMSTPIADSEHVVDNNVNNTNHQLLSDYNPNGMKDQLDAPFNPAQSSTNKHWHADINSDERYRMVVNLVKSIFPSPDPASMHDQRIMDLILYARKVEKDMFESADDHEEYYHLLAEKIYKIQKELQEKKEKRLEEARRAVEIEADNAMRTIRMKGILFKVDASRSRHIMSSFKIKEWPESSRTTLSFDFKSADDFSNWISYLACFEFAGNHISILSRRIEVSVASDKVNDLLKHLNPLAKRFDFENVLIETNSIMASLAEFLECTTVENLTITQKHDDGAEEFAAHLEFVRRVKPTTISVERQDNTKSLLDFLIKLADLTESMWIGESLLNKEALPITVIQAILSRKCKYLHIRDDSTKLSLGGIDNMEMYFRSWGLKVSLVMPTSVFHVDAQIEEYRVKSGDGKKFEKDLVVIEHNDIDPKVIDMP